jgi:hypothetical protein
VEIAQKADAAGTKYFIFPVDGGDVELAIYSLRGPLEPWIWCDLMNRRDDIVAALRTLNVTRPVGITEILEMVKNYDKRSGLN